SGSETPAPAYPVSARKTLETHRTLGTPPSAAWHGSHDQQFHWGRDTSGCLQFPCFSPTVQCCCSTPWPGTHRQRPTRAQSISIWQRPSNRSSSRSSVPLEARRAFFDECPDAFPGICSLTADILCKCLKFKSGAQIHVLVVIQRPLGQADGNRWPSSDFV